MVQSKSKTVEDYLAELPDERRSAIETVREIILNRIPKGYEEVMQYGMISYVIPFERYPNTYNDQPLGIVSLASQKNYMSLFLMGVYGDGAGEKQFRKAYLATGKKLDMGKSCVRFKTIDDLPLDLIGDAVSKVTVDEFIELYERSRQ